MFTAARGSTTEAVTGEGLSLIRDESLRSDVAGFWDRWEAFFGNQERVVNYIKLSETVIFGTGSLVQPYPSDPALGAHAMWSPVLTPDEVRAVKYFAWALFSAELLIEQGSEIVSEIDAVLERLKAHEVK